MMSSVPSLPHDPKHWLEQSHHLYGRDEEMRQLQEFVMQCNQPMDEENAGPPHFDGKDLLHLRLGRSRQNNSLQSFETLVPRIER